MHTGGMHMNIIKILETIGYKVIKYNHNRQVYLVNKVPARVKRERLKRNPDIKIRIHNIDFDRDGDLYIEFIDERGNVCDTYWHNNMTILYDIDFDEVDDEDEEEIDEDHDEWLMTDCSIFRKMLN